MMSTAPIRRARRAPRPILAAATLALLLLPWVASARKDDRQQPLNYTANYTHAFNAPNSVSTLRGHVVIIQGTIHGTGDEAKIYMDGDQQIDHVVMTGVGKKAHIEELDDDGNLMTGDADTIIYHYQDGIAYLVGHAVAKQAGRGDFYGDKLTYDTQQSLIIGESNGDGLVHGVIYPKNKPVPVAAPAPSGKAHPGLHPAAAGSSARPASSASTAKPATVQLQPASASSSHSRAND